MTTYGVLYSPVLSYDVCCMVCGGVSPGEQLPSLKDMEAVAAPLPKHLLLIGWWH